jgi:uncharacterized membrane protein
MGSGTVAVRRSVSNGSHGRLILAGHARQNHPTHLISELLIMNHRLVVSSALASVLALGLAGNAAAQAKDPGKSHEKCFGVAKAGQNDCANQSGTHSCAGQSKADMNAADWRYVAKGTCKNLKGMTEEEAKATLAKK